MQKKTTNQMEQCNREIRYIIDSFTKSLSEVNVDEGFYKTVKALANCKGKIITTGMGKAGTIMKKFSSTLCSLGFPSVYVHPGEATHGDSGVISREDLLFVASTSGKTREILEVLSIAEAIGVSKIIGITSHLDSPIRECADFLLDMGEFEEAGHIGLAPTTSTLIMLAITDAVACVAADMKGYSVEDFHIHHHSGYLGEKARGIIEDSSTSSD